MYDPSLYALVHRGTPGDADFYARQSAGLRVLELGCGYGRLLQDLSATADAYVGLEQDPGMLRMAEARREVLPPAARARVRLVEGDMRALSLGERFDRILIPHSGLYCLGGARGVARCLASAREHLAEDGELLLDAYHADPFHEASSPEDVPDDQLEPVAEVEHEGVPLRVLERSTWEPDARRMDVTYEYRRADGRAFAEGTIVHHYLLCDELATLLHAAGFTRMRFCGDFAGVPLDDDHELMVVRAAAG
ncbi:MAG: class I SAM-dependent methyltransferase [Myxococcales bacterium]|jgi:SAM-dependent methyltransferase